MPDRTSHEPGTISWSDLATTDADGREGVLRRPVRLGVRRHAGGRGRDLLDGEARRPHRGGDLAAAARRGRPGHPAALERLRDRRGRRRVDRGNVADAGGTVLAGPFDVFDAGRMSVVADPAGAVLCLWQAGTNIGAEVVNEPGALSLGRHRDDRRGGGAGVLLGAVRLALRADERGAAVLGDLQRRALQRRHDGAAAGRARRTGSPTSRSTTSTRRSRRRGGGRRQPVHGPDRRAHGGRFALIQDPQGAAFARPRRRDFDD